MRVKIKKISVVEEERDVYIGRNIYLVVLRYTSGVDGSQYLEVIPTFSIKGNPPYREDFHCEIVGVYEYVLALHETIPDYEVGGDAYLRPIGY